MNEILIKKQSVVKFHVTDWSLQLQLHAFCHLNVHLKILPKNNEYHIFHKHETFFHNSNNKKRKTQNLFNYKKNILENLLFLKTNLKK